MSQQSSFRHQLDRLRRAVDRKREESRAQAQQESMIADARPPEELSTRAKSSGHKKKTADKWNQ
jgi:hypothetical protein